MVSPKLGSVAQKSGAPASSLFFLCHRQCVSDTFSYDHRMTAAGPSIMFFHSNVQKQRERSKLSSYNSLFSQKVKLSQTPGQQTPPYIALARKIGHMVVPSTRKSGKMNYLVFLASCNTQCLTLPPTGPMPYILWPSLSPFFPWYHFKNSRERLLVAWVGSDSYF